MLEWYEYNRIPTEAVKYPLSVHAGKFETSNETYEFTLEDLYNYYNSPSEEQTSPDISHSDSASDTAQSNPYGDETTYDTVISDEFGTEPQDTTKAE